MYCNYTYALSKAALGNESTSSMKTFSDMDKLQVPRLSSKMKPPVVPSLLRVRAESESLNMQRWL
jgi:hypothetical protein